MIDKSQVALTAEVASRKAVGARIAAVRGSISQVDFATRTGVHKNTLGNYERGDREPDAAFCRSVRSEFGIDINWLLTGDGPMRHGGTEDSRPEPAADTPVERGLGNVVSMSGVSAHSVPVLGLAECGLAGWYQDGPMAVRATRPGDLRDPDAFAVLAVGDSMIPAGISPGYLCFCSPADTPDFGDAVYVERDDGRAAIKVFGGIKDGWLSLQGWLPGNDKDVPQMPYVDKIRADKIRRLAPVIYVKRKL